ncbi:hypothetical protein FH972_013244 [Carpinus fangiana]|uniref:Uncharacterized protein n=1 Tax=Carpinus fangiana TaxID=176857 RepID=A0A5N6R665_9ROSI|nr:hypothetical protein FH972_013244 [Carpinus fangiana]
MDEQQPSSSPGGGGGGGGGEAKQKEVEQPDGDHHQHPQANAKPGGCGSFFGKHRMAAAISNLNSQINIIQADVKPRLRPRSAASVDKGPRGCELGSLVPGSPQLKKSQTLDVKAKIDVGCNFLSLAHDCFKLGCFLGHAYPND